MPIENEVPVVCVFGAHGVEAVTKGTSEYTKNLPIDCRCYETDDDLDRILATVRPQAILTVGDVLSFGRLHVAPFYIRRMWIHLDSLEALTPQQIGQKLFTCIVGNMVDRGHARKGPLLVSVFTSTYKVSWQQFKRAYDSLRNQKYRDWEWVIYDDSNDGNVTFDMIAQVCVKDPQVRLYKSHDNSGKIGEVKFRAASLCQGDILVELDHDDVLTPNCLDVLVKAFDQFPDAGFAYSDWLELWDGTFESRVYGEGWGYGYGAYRDGIYRDVPVKIAVAANINAKTIRHLVAAPNHVRAWRASTYFEVGRHNPLVHIADDFELIVRTFLNTKMIRVQELCYVQYYKSGENTQSKRNKDIQRMVAWLVRFYDRQIHDRFKELGVDDFVWSNGSSDMSVPNPKVESCCNHVF